MMQFEAHILFAGDSIADLYMLDIKHFYHSLGRNDRYHEIPVLMAPLPYGFKHGNQRFPALPLAMSNRLRTSSISSGRRALHSASRPVGTP